MKRIRWGTILYALILTVLLMLAGWQLFTFLGLWTHRGNASFASSEGGSVQELDQQAGILRPMRIYASSGEREGRSSLVDDQTGHYERLYEASWQFMREVLSYGEETKILPKEEVTTEGALCRYEYALSLDARTVGERTGWLYTGDFSFQEIWMVPAQSVRENAYVYLVDQEEGQVLQIASPGVQWQDEVNTKLLEVVGEICSALGEKYLDASYVFAGVFGRSFYFRDQREPQTKILWDFTLEEFSRENSEKIAARFFDDSGLMRGKSYQESAWIFTDDRCTVRIQDNGMIDYVKTPVDAREDRISVDAAYDAAFAFLQQDLSHDEYPLGTYLCGIEETEEGYIFYWNYKADDLPVIPGEAFLEENGMKASIQIEVQNGEVYRYDRWRIQQNRNLYRPWVISEGAVEALDRFAEYEKEGWEKLDMVCLLEEDGTAAFYWRLSVSGVNCYERVRE